jgi:nitrous oxidase accessory protein
MRSYHICYRSFFVIIFVVTLLVLFEAVNAAVPIGDTTNSSGGVHNINKNTHYLTIQAAIDNASSGDEIHVKSDLYYENVNVSKQLFLKGINTGAGNPVVDAGGSGNVITLSAGNSTLEGFDVVGSSWLDAGIYVSSYHNLIRNNNVSNNYKGIFLDESSHSNTLISNNVSNNGLFGIFLGSSGNNTMRDNYISGTIGDGSIGLYLYASSDNTIDGNHILNNQWTGIHLDYSSTNNILNGNNVSNNTGDGIILFDSNSNNILEGNNVSNNNADGISISGSINNTLISNNVFNNNGFGISLWSSSSSMLTRNNVLNNNGAGIYLRGSLSNTLDGNNVFKNNNAGISLGTDSDNNTLKDNNVLNNTGEGISIWYYGNNNTINGNIVSNNLKNGISLVDYSNNNNINNNFFNNVNNYEILNSSNIWSGNIWANPNGTGFSQTCEDNNGDKICDSTYTFDNNSDYHPLAYLLDQALSPSFSVSPSTGYQGQLFKVELIINNNHFETIYDVRPSLLIGTLDRDAPATMISGPVPGLADIPGRGSQVYTWIYRASGLGKLELNGSASGVDVVTGKKATSIKIYNNVPVEVLSEGGVSISVLPRLNSIFNGTSNILNINTKNTQNIGDIFKIRINVSELPLSYQADPGWFNWTEQIIYLKAGQEIITPIKITIPETISGTRMFRANMIQETSGIYAYDTGYLKII